MNTQEKIRIVKKIRAEMEGWFHRQSGDKGPIGGYCIWWTYFTIRVLREHGIPAQLQAGSAAWPRLTPEQDDGLPTTATHFTYQYTPGPHNLMKVMMTASLPEIHIWAAVAETNTIIDVTTKFWPEQCQRVIGADWPGVRPPSFFWADRLPPGVRYIADIEAMQIAYGFLKHWLRTRKP